MKFYKLLFLFSCTATLILGACSSDEQNRSGKDETITKKSDETSTDESKSADVNNLIDKNDFTEGIWINQEGENMENEEMITSGIISYNPDSEFELSRTGYVSYYNDDSFIKTVLYDYNESYPLSIETVQDSNNIRVSFNKRYTEDVVLIEK